MQWIQHYFSDLRPRQLDQLKQLHDLLLEWNQKLNLVSRADAENLEERHLLSSLAIARQLRFPQGSSIMDVGTGGGLPGLPLAIVHPHCQFLLVDSIGKKIRAVEDMASRLGLRNVRARQTRVESITQKFDFVTGRAVKALPLFLTWVKPRLKTGKTGGIERGVLYLKGGDLESEFRELGIQPLKQTQLTDFYPDHPFFETKWVLHIASDDLRRIRQT